MGLDFFDPKAPHLGPASIKNDFARLDVPIPRTQIGALERELEALLRQTDPLFGALLLRNIAERHGEYLRSIHLEFRYRRVRRKLLPILPTTADLRGAFAHTARDLPAGPEFLYFLPM